jgi:hypothetical protein
MVCAPTPVVQYGEPIDENALALFALKEFYQTAFAERCIIFSYGHTVAIGGTFEVTTLANMEYEMVSGHPHGKDMICYPLVEQVVR